jgi:hypothetical protein
MNTNFSNVTGLGFRDVTAGEMQTVEGGIWALIGRAVFTGLTFLARQGFSRASHNGSSGDGPSCPVEDE